MLFLMFGIMTGPLLAQVSPMPEVLNLLTSDWEYNGKKYSVPFSLNNTNNAQLYREFDLACIAEDSLFLYVEGVAWEAELVLNGLFIAIHKDPFLPWVVPLAPEWLQASGNKLELNIQFGRRYELYPQGFLGLHRPVMLLTRAQLAVMEQPLMEVVETADTLAIWAPYFGETFGFQAFEAARMSLPLTREKIKYVFFPYEPVEHSRLFVVTWA